MLSLLPKLLQPEGQHCGMSRSRDKGSSLFFFVWHFTSGNNWVHCFQSGGRQPAPCLEVINRQMNCELQRLSLSFLLYLAFIFLYPSTFRSLLLSVFTPLSSDFFNFLLYCLNYLQCIFNLLMRWVVNPFSVMSDVGRTRERWSLNFTCLCSKCIVMVHFNL